MDVVQAMTAKDPYREPTNIQAAEIAVSRKTWSLGHRMDLPFRADTHNSVVSRCLKCDGIGAADAQMRSSYHGRPALIELSGRATSEPCTHPWWR